MDLSTLRFGDAFVRGLPADPSELNRSRAVFGAAYSRVMPTRVTAPRMVAWSSALGAELGLPPDAHTSAALCAVLAGNGLAPGMVPYAACYGGHQFGHWAGQLGDGRAIVLGEQITPSGARLEWQLKGAGRTPYSRAGDGRAVLRSSVREFLCSEAMHHLGIPTTRALSLVSSGESVIRDMFYDGHPRAEPGAIVCRVAPSFLRFGNFQLPASRHELDLLKGLSDYAIRTFFPALDLRLPGVYGAWFAEICRSTAVMVAEWMRVGFVHGVMNTDNMSILGLTIDYGPYGWLDTYDPDFTPNTTDAQQGRYRFGQQPAVAAWNLSRLAESLESLVADEAALLAGLSVFRETFLARWQQIRAAKLGLARLQGGQDIGLWDELETMMCASEVDMTILFRTLGDLLPEANELLAGSDAALFDRLSVAFYPVGLGPPPSGVAWIAWLRRYFARILEGPLSLDEAQATAKRANPKFIPRNYLAQEAIDAAESGDPSLVVALAEVLRHPYDEQPSRSRYNQKRPEWARDRAGCSALSCSS